MCSHESFLVAKDAAGVLAARDIDVLLFDSVAPTPLCAFAVRKLDTAAGIVVTASHNPPAYNGYKVRMRAYLVRSSGNDADLVSDHFQVYRKGGT